MKILVTGGAGYVGVVLIRKLLEHGHVVACLDSLKGKSGLSLIPLFENKERFRLVEGDLRDRTVLADCLRDADTVIHLAALVGYPACKSDVDGCRSINIEGTRLLAEERAPGQMVIFASTGSVYGEVTEGECTETTPAMPVSHYARSKLDAEEILMEAGNVIVYRFATAFGLSPQLRLDLLINSFCYHAIHNRLLVLYEGEFRRSFIHVTDMARAIHHGLERFSQMRNEVYNCGDETLNASKRQIAETIRESVDYQLVLSDTGCDEDRRNCEISYRKIRSTGFKAEISLRAGISEMIAAFPHIHLSNASSGLI